MAMKVLGFDMITYIRTYIHTYREVKIAMKALGFDMIAYIHTYIHTYMQRSKNSYESVGI